MIKPRLPVGKDLFTKIREDEFYYIDKTDFITALIKQENEVSLFTRPRRFGKTLNMSMLDCFLTSAATVKHCSRGFLSRRTGSFAPSI